MKDPIVKEIHAIRNTIAEECNHDIQKIGQYFIEWQKKYPELLVREVKTAKASENVAE
jgi:hypothetical protein